MKSKQAQEFKETEIGKIPADWTVEKLQDNLIIKGRIGWKGLKKSEFSETGDCIIVNGTDIKNGKINWNSCLRIPKWRYDESPEIKLRNGDILMTKDGTIGKTCFLYDLTENATVASGIFVIRNHSEILLQNFFFVYLNSFYFKALVNTRIEGSVIPHLYQRDLKQLLIPLPTLPEQEKICSHIENLNSKIKNLQNQNKILEQTARAIFKSWFVDFDGQTEFEDSELDQIPKGWKVDKISSVCDTFGGGTPSTKNPDYWNGNNHWLIPSDLTKSGRLFSVDSKRKITDEGLKNCASELHPENSILMTSRATIGVFSFNKIPVATNQGFIVIRPNNPNHLYYLFLNFFSRVNEFINEANGTTFLEISRGRFRQLPILIPPSELLDKFQHKIKCFFENQFYNEQMIESLTKIRDALLPKLMSGEIRV